MKNASIARALVLVLLVTLLVLGFLLVLLNQSGTRWADLGVGLVTGVVVGVSLYLIDRQRAAREKIVAEAEAKRVEADRERLAAERAHDAMEAERLNRRILVQLVLQAEEVRNVVLDNAEMSYMSFNRRSISHSRFARCDFNGSDFSHSVVESVNFSTCKLIDSSFRMAKVHNARFSGSVLVGADFRGARMTGCDFTGATTEGALFDDARFEGCIGLDDSGIAT